MQDHPTIRGFGPAAGRDAVVRVLRDDVPFMSTEGSLATRHRAGFRAMVDFLAGLGLAPAPHQSLKRTDGAATGAPPLPLDPRRVYGYGTITGADVAALRDAARITYVPDIVAAADVLQPASIRLNGNHWTAPTAVQSHGVAVSGPVALLVDDDGDPFPASTPKPAGRSFVAAFCVSIPGINFAYDAADVRAFATADNRVNDAGHERMRQIWHHVLTLYRDAGVRCAVLCAIGCGEFRGNVEGVPAAYAAALTDVLLADDYGLASVIVCTPGPRGAESFAAFGAAAAAAAERGPLRVPIVVTASHGMLGVAARFAASGILNPADRLSVRTGALGLFWRSGPIALEELLAVQTTLLLHHADANPALWTPARVRPVALRLGRTTAGGGGVHGGEQLAGR
jgi:hypothetical protein